VRDIRVDSERNLTFEVICDASLQSCRMDQPIGDAQAAILVHRENAAPQAVCDREAQ